MSTQAPSVTTRLLRTTRVPAERRPSGPTPPTKVSPNSHSSRPSGSRMLAAPSPPDQPVVSPSKSPCQPDASVGSGPHAGAMEGRAAARTGTGTVVPPSASARAAAGAVRRPAPASNDTVATATLCSTQEGSTPRALVLEEPRLSCCSSLRERGHGRRAHRHRRHTPGNR
mgnify:CR=1 FL=1